MWSRLRIFANEESLVESAIPIVVGIVFLVPGARDWFWAVSSTSWPTTPGIVVDSCLVDSPASRGVGSKRPLVTYRYTVDGIEHASTNFQFRPHNWSLEDATQVVKSHAPGSKVAVYYAPYDPEVVCLSPGASWMNPLPVVVGLGALAAGGFVLNRARRQGGFRLRRGAARFRRW